MGPIKKDYLVGLVLLFSCAPGLVHVSTLPRQAALFPKMVQTVILLLSLLLIINTYRSGGEREKLWASPKEISNLCLFSLITVFYLLLLPLIGFFSSSVLFIPVSSWLLGFRKLRLIAGSTAGFVFLVYVIFVLFFDHPLPEEWWRS